MPQTSKQNHITEVGHIISSFAGVIKIEGLPLVMLNEVLQDEQGTRAALVVGFDKYIVEALLFDPSFDHHRALFRTKKLFSIPFSDQYIGRVVDGLGAPLDGFSAVEGKAVSVFREAPAIKDREPVVQPLTTGIKLIDATLPLGRGQRELIIGDRKLGKTAIALQTVLNQKEAAPPVYCVYVVIGQKRRDVQDITQVLRDANAFSYSVVVASSAEDSFVAQYLAPFVGCTIGEYLRDHGLHALVVYDDLSKHAKVYRDFSLLLERAPGRESYPGDIFSLHGQLLERSAKLSRANKGGSLSALPIVETQEGDITSFIPTNIISITDGQIYLERGLYQKEFLPAVNIGLSVSRVGSQAQPPLLKEVTGGLRLMLAQHSELQKITQLESSLSKDSAKTLQRGNLILELLKQGERDFVAWTEQVVLFYSVTSGLFDDITPALWRDLESMFLDLLRTKYQRILDSLARGIFNDAIKKEISAVATDFKKEFINQSK